MIKLMDLELWSCQTVESTKEISKMVLSTDKVASTNSVDQASRDCGKEENLLGRINL